MSSDPSAREAQDMTWPAAKASSISIKHQGCCRCLARVRSRNIDEERCRKFPPCSQAIWLAEVVPQRGAGVAKFRTHLRAANQQANPELLRIALKLATGAGKTTVMAMLIACQTGNAVRHP
jgi:hypothetical protein